MYQVPKTWALSFKSKHYKLHYLLHFFPYLVIFGMQILTVLYTSLSLALHSDGVEVLNDWYFWGLQSSEKIVWCNCVVLNCVFLSFLPGIIVPSEKWRNTTIQHPQFSYFCPWYFQNPKPVFRVPTQYITNSLAR